MYSLWGCTRENQRSAYRCQPAPSTMCQGLWFWPLGLLARAVPSVPPRQPPLLLLVVWRLLGRLPCFRRSGTPFCDVLVLFSASLCVWSRSTFSVPSESGFLMVLVPGCHSPIVKMYKEWATQSRATGRGKDPNSSKVPTNGYLDDNMMTLLRVFFMCIFFMACWKQPYCLLEILFLLNSPNSRGGRGPSVGSYHR